MQVRVLSWALEKKIATDCQSVAIFLFNFAPHLHHTSGYCPAPPAKRFGFRRLKQSLHRLISINALSLSRTITPSRRLPWSWQSHSVRTRKHLNPAASKACLSIEVSLFLFTYTTFIILPYYIYCRRRCRGTTYWFGLWDTCWQLLATSLLRPSFLHHCGVDGNSYWLYRIVLLQCKYTV